MGVMDLFDDS
jgi:ribonuclease III